MIMSQLLSPGEALYVPGFINPDQAMRLGGFVRPLCEKTVRLDMAYFISGPNKYIPGEAFLNDGGRDALQALNNRVDQVLAGPIPKEEYVLATYMNSPIRRFAWHVDPYFDVRPIINIGEDETAILLSTTRGVFPKDPDAIFTDESPAEENQVVLTLQPGDAYFLDNRVDRADRIPHATPLNAMGRLMLRYSRTYPSWENEPFDFGQFEDTRSVSLLEPAA